MSSHSIPYCIVGQQVKTFFLVFLLKQKTCLYAHLPNLCFKFSCFLVLLGDCMTTMHYFQSYSLSSAPLVSSSPLHIIRQDGTMNKLINYSRLTSLVNHFFKIKQLCCLLSTNIDIFLGSSPTTVSDYDTRICNVN